VRRLATIGTVCALALIGAACFSWALFGSRAAALGNAAFVERVMIRAARAIPSPGAPRVIWLGDSTLMTPPGVSYADRVAAHALAPRGVQSNVLALLGLGPLQFYCLMGAVLEAQPSAIVIVANLRVLADPKTPYPDLCSEVPTDELLRASLLPFHERGLSMPRVLLYRALRIPWVERVVFGFEGLRRMFHDAPMWSWLGPPERPENVAVAFSEFVRVHDVIFRQYDGAVWPREASVRLLGAAVALAARNRVRVLVVVTPIPRERLAAAGWYDPERYAQRIAVLRDVVTTNGGRLLDVHDLLPTSGFKDNGGHMTPDGFAAVAARVEPALLELLTQPGDS
jgi:hypothetical protein